MQEIDRTKGDGTYGEDDRCYWRRGTMHWNMTGNWLEYDSERLETDCNSDSGWCHAVKGLARTPWGHLVRANDRPWISVFVAESQSPALNITPQRRMQLSVVRMIVVTDCRLETTLKVDLHSGLHSVLHSDIYSVLCSVFYSKTGSREWKAMIGDESKGISWRTSWRSLSDKAERLTPLTPSYAHMSLSCRWEINWARRDRHWEQRDSRLAMQEGTDAGLGQQHI
jgi:hypothetical protein